MSKPRVSAIMLVLNERFYIKASMYNALQFFDEILVLDGGSQDGTFEFLEEFASKFSRVKIEQWPQADARHYHPSWNQPARWNKLIEKARFDWIAVLGADECWCDHARPRRLIMKYQDTPAFAFPRYAVTGRHEYTPNWFPDYQLRLFDRAALGGVRFKNMPRHCTPKTHMGAGSTPPKKNFKKYYLVHYHHGFGPKRHSLGKGMRVEKLPGSFDHPRHARKYIINHPERVDFKYDFRLYGRAGFVPKETR